MFKFEEAVCRHGSCFPAAAEFVPSYCVSSFDFTNHYKFTRVASGCMSHSDTHRDTQKAQDGFCPSSANGDEQSLHQLLAASYPQVCVCLCVTQGHRLCVINNKPPRFWKDKVNANGHKTLSFKLVLGTLSGRKVTFTPVHTQTVTNAQLVVDIS